MKLKGDAYEDMATSLILGEGLQVLQRNFRAKTGEIDIIARDGQQVIFIEVRARNNRNFDSAAGSVNAAKQQRLLRTAQLYLQRRPKLANMPCRFDVIAFEPRQSPTDNGIRWIRSAFTA